MHKRIKKKPKKVDYIILLRLFDHKGGTRYTEIFIVASGSGTTIFSVNSPCSSASTYFPIVFYYIAKSSNETITVGAQNDPATTFFDDISVMSNGVELLCNGGFENGTQICWQGAYHLQSGCGHTGSYCYSDPVVGSVDYITQSFNTTLGALLNISFWTYWTGSGTGVVTIVTITP